MRKLQWIEFLLLAFGLACAASSSDAAEEADLWSRRGQSVVERGCLGCHKMGDEGGALGPDITSVGEKVAGDLDLLCIHRRPTTALSDSLKPSLGLWEDEARALADYMVGRKRNAQAMVGPALPRSANLTPSEGKTLYLAFCSACHGSEGQGGIVCTPDDFPTSNRPKETIAPALNNPDMLGVASDDYLRNTIHAGRSGTTMLAWGKEGRLSENTIRALVDHVRLWEGIAPSMEDISPSQGNTHHGRMLYRSRCEGCHDRNGQDPIGVSLRSASLLAVASDEFLARTIIHGRVNTAMPSWNDLTAQQVSHLLAHLRGWEAVPADKREVLTQVAQEETGGESLLLGQLLYVSKCADCHGAKGEGILGPSLNKDTFLSVVDDAYLYTAITEGRPSTAMPAWKHLSTGDLAALIRVLRDWNDNRRRVLDTYSSSGDPTRGAVVFQQTCRACHGRAAQAAVGPQLTNPSFLAQATDAMLREWIQRRCDRTDTDAVPIDDVVAYLRSLPRGAWPAVTGRVSGDINKGRALYNFVCAECHGPNGQGLTGSALSNPDFLRSASDGFLLASIVVGRDGTRMRPDLAKLLSSVKPGATHSALEDIVAFLRHWEANPPITGIPTRHVTGANLHAGAELYSSNCAGCHGLQGDNGWAPALGNPEFLGTANDGFLQATVMRGRGSTAMRPFAVGSDGIGELRGGEVNNIVAYVRGWAKGEN